MSRKVFSYRQLYVCLQKAAAWESKTLWTPQGVIITGTWVMYDSFLPKYLSKAHREAIIQEFRNQVIDERNVNQIIRETIHALHKRGIINLTPATEPYIQLSFYHPKA